MKSLLVCLFLAGLATLTLPHSVEESEALVKFSHQQGGVIFSLLHLTKKLSSEESGKSVGCSNIQVEKNVKPECFYLPKARL